MSPLNIIESTGEPTANNLGAHPHQHPLLVLSDVISLVSLGLEKGWVPQQSKHVSHKLVFYGAHVATLPTPLLRSVVGELAEKSQVLREEAKGDERR